MSTTHTKSNQQELREVFIGRQPILDKDLRLIGHELLFRATSENSAAPADGVAATADVVCKAFAELGLAKSLGHVVSFIKVDDVFLTNDLVLLLPPSSIVLEIHAGHFRDDGSRQRCHELKKRGYTFCLSELSHVDAESSPLIDLATWIKVELNRIPQEQLQAHSRELAMTRRRLIAARVETQSQMELCRLLGFELFQGYYFARPVVIGGRRLDATMQGLTNILKLLTNDADADVLEDAFRREPALVINLLRLVNSVGVGMRTGITSVHHAITTLGRDQLKRWLHLLLFSRGGKLDTARNSLLQHAALRGRFMELLADRLLPEASPLREPAFLTGLMSVVPAALRMTMSNVLAQISADDEIRLALSDKQGELGQLLAITESYDNNDIAELQTLLRPYGEQATLAILGEILAEALDWVRQLGTEAA